MGVISSSVAGEDRALTLPVRMERRVGLRSALAGLILQAAVVAAFVALALLAAGLPGHMARQLEQIGQYAALASVLLFCALGGALWAWTLARITGLGGRRRMAWAGAIVYPPAVIIAILLLNEVEKTFVEGAGRDLLPVHVVFAIAFTLAAATVTALMGLALGLAVRDRRLAIKLALYGGVTAGVAFLVAAVVQDLLGRRVGGPNAAATATMLTVMLISNIAASLAASTVMGIMLRRRVTASTSTVAVNANAAAGPHGSTSSWGQIS